MRNIIVIAIFLLVIVGFTSSSFAENPVATQLEQHDTDMTAEHVILSDEHGTLSDEHSILDGKIDQVLTSINGIQPMGLVFPGTTAKVYENAIQPTLYVTITATDYSPNDDSSLTVRNSNGDLVRSVTVSDISTTTYTLSAGTLNTIELECNGTGGYCQYRIDSVVKP